MIKYIVRLSLVHNGIAFYIILLIQNHSSIMFPQSQCPYATASVRNNLTKYLGPRGPTKCNGIIT